MKATLVALALARSTGPLELVSPGPRPRIVGGEETASDAFRAVVALEVGGFLCAGTLVRTDLVLTAAHCLRGAMKPSDVVVHFGQDLKGPSTTASGFGSHPSYCGDTACGDESYDFGYVVLAAPATIGTAFPRSFADQAEWDARMNEGDPVTLVGYGSSVATCPDDPSCIRYLGTKRFVDTRLGPRTDRGFRFIAGGMGEDSCRGDSGGPAFVRGDRGELILAGVLSTGYDPCGKGGTYGTLAVALPWLDEVVNYPGPGAQARCFAPDCLDPSPPAASGCQAAPAIDLWHLAAVGGCLFGRRRRRRSRTTPASTVVAARVYDGAPAPSCSWRPLRAR